MGIFAQPHSAAVLPVPDLPVERWLQYPNTITRFNDDFVEFNTVTTTGNWVATAATSGTALRTAGKGGILSLDSGAATAGQGMNVVKTIAIAKAESGKDIWFFARIKTTFPLKLQTFIGLATGGAETTHLGSGALSDTLSFIGFVIRASGDTAGYLQLLTKDGTTTANETVEADIHLLVTDTWTIVAFKVSGTGEVQAYINGVAAGDPITTNIPTTDLTPVIVAQANGTSRPVLDVDLIEVWQDR